MNAMLACLTALAVGSSFAVRGQPIEVEIDANTSLRPISNEFFGAVLPYAQTGMRALLSTDDGVQVLRSAGTESLRWPGGTDAYFFLWDAPDKSYKRRTISKDAQNWVLRHDEVDGWASKLDLSVLIQVNTYRYRTPGGKVKTIGDEGIEEGAEYAARWVRQSTQSSHAHTDWEIGNEDWTRWTPAQYARVANAYLKQMRPLVRNGKIAVTGMAAPYHDVDPVAWTRGVVEGTNKSQADALSIHTYIDGGVSPSIPLADRLTSIFGQLSQGAPHIDEMRGVLKRAGAKWEIWVTEYNLKVDDPTAKGGLVTFQNVAHGLAVANWAGEMLRQGVDRAYYHNLIGHPAFCLLLHTPRAPTARIMVPALVLDAMQSHFANRTLVQVRTRGGTQIRAEGGRGTGAAQPVAIPAVVAYAARDPRSGDVAVMLLNRDLNSERTVRVAIAGEQAFEDQVNVISLGDSNELDDSNVTEEKVRWHESTEPLSTVRSDFVLKPHSLYLLELAKK